MLSFLLVFSFTNYPEEDKADPEACSSSPFFVKMISLGNADMSPLDKAAIDALSPGDAVIIFTPDSTHAPIAEYALSRKIVGVQSIWSVKHALTLCLSM